MHSQIQHRGESRASSLRDLRDLMLLDGQFGSPAVWDRIAARFRRVHRLDAVSLYLRSAEVSLGMTPPVRVPVGAFQSGRDYILRSVPMLAYLDPSKVYRTLLARRVREAREVWKRVGGPRHLLLSVFRPSFYQYLWWDFKRISGQSNPMNIWEFPLDDGLVLARPDVHGLFLLNPTASFIWTLHAAHCGHAEISRELASACGIPLEMQIVTFPIRSRHGRKEFLAREPVYGRLSLNSTRRLSNRSGSARSSCTIDLSRSVFLPT